ncbi:hypothetical protein MRX96_006098 [Rhipicephalus microplus]
MNSSASGGRLDLLNVSPDIRHAILLSTEPRLTTLIAQAAHTHTLDGRIKLTLIKIRARFWVLNGSDKFTAVHQIPSSPKGNAACLLWRKLNAGKRNRHRCRAAFKKRCAKYGTYRFVFTREACLKKRMTKASVTGAVGLN